MTDQPAHSHYGMSSIKRWTSCLASPRMCANAPPGYDEVWTVEGKVAHSLLQRMLEAQEEDAAKYIGSAIAYDSETEGLVAAVIKPETARAVQIALDEIYVLLEEDPGAQIWIEQKVEIPSRSVPGRLWGTADILLYQPRHKRLVAVDYKHGAGIFVDVTNNLQVKGYALAAFLTLVLDRPVAEIWLGIVQPRAFSDDGSVRWDKSITVVGLLDYWAWLDDKAALTLYDDAPFAPDKDYCRWCPAAVNCLAYEQAALGGTGAESIAAFVARPVLDPKKMPLDRIAMILAAEPFFRGLFKSARAVAMGAMFRGYDVAGQKLVNGRAKRAWYGEQDAIADVLMNVTGLPRERFYAPVLVGLTEAEQILVDTFRNGVQRQEGETKKSMKVRQDKASEMAREIMAQVTLKEPGGNVTIAASSDPRPRVENASANLAGLIQIPEDE